MIYDDDNEEIYQPNGLEMLTYQQKMRLKRDIWAGKVDKRALCLLHECTMRELHDFLGMEPYKGFLV